MGILFARKPYILAAGITVIVCVLMIVFSETAVMSANKGINLWLSSVLPAMLPFFVCVNYMTGIGLINLLPAGIFPFIMSAVSGYPMGAKVVGDMCRSGTVDIHTARRLLSYCSTSGPAFMVGAVGVGMMDSQAAGYVIAVSHYAAALLNGILYSLLSQRHQELFDKVEYSFQLKQTKQRKVASIDQRIEECDLLQTLTISIFSAFKSMAVILTYIIFFMFIMDIIDMSGILDNLNSAELYCLAKGFVEMTIGCNSLGNLGCNVKTGSILASIIISWGGLSIAGQSMSMLSGTRIGFRYLVMTKLTHSIFAGIISLFLANVML